MRAHRPSSFARVLAWVSVVAVGLSAVGASAAEPWPASTAPIVPGAAVPAPAVVEPQPEPASQPNLAPSSEPTGASVVTRRAHPAACLTPADRVAVTCDQLGPALLATRKYASVDCLPDGAACDCTVGTTPQAFTATGTYSITDGVLLAGTAHESDYCVKGDGTAAFGTHPGSSVMGHPGLTAGSLTLTKQP